MPTYRYKRQRICYIWIDKVLDNPYIGFIDGQDLNHTALVAGARKRMATYTVSLDQDIDIATIRVLLDMAIAHVSEK